MRGSSKEYRSILRSYAKGNGQAVNGHGSMLNPEQCVIDTGLEDLYSGGDGPEKLEDWQGRTKRVRLA